MGIPMANGLRTGFSSPLPATPLGIPMVSGLWRGLSSKLPAIHVGSPLGLFLRALLWLVA